MARPKTPTKILEMKGAFIKNPQRRNKNEAKPSKPLGTPADILTEDELRWWNFIVARIPNGIAFNSDEIALIMAAKAMNEIMQADRFSASAYNQLHSIISKFGLTPADRAKIQAEAEEEKDDWADL